jgi:hypothetical protein
MLSFSSLFANRHFLLLPDPKHPDFRYHIFKEHQLAHILLLNVPVHRVHFAPNFFCDFLSFSIFPPVSPLPHSQIYPCFPSGCSMLNSGHLNGRSS